MSPKRQDFEAKLMEIFGDAQSRKESNIVIVSGDLRRLVDDHPGRGGYRMPICHDVMKQLMKEGDKILHEPKKGKGATLKIQYFLPR